MILYSVKYNTMYLDLIMKSMCDVTVCENLSLSLSHIPSNIIKRQSIFKIFDILRRQKNASNTIN